MKRTLLGVSLLFAASTVLAQVTVTLTASPANSVKVGAPVVLTATVRTPGKGIMFPGATAPAHYVRDRLRFTYNAQRSWPCADSAPSPLAENLQATGGTLTPVAATHVSTFTWTPPAAKAGEYTFSVDVIYLNLGRGLDVTHATKLGKEKVGSATLSYKVTPTSSINGNLLSSVSPPSPATAPVSLSLSLSVSPPPEFKWYRYQYWCSGGCQPGTGVKDHQGTSTSFSMNLPNPGQYTFTIGADQIRQSDCLWEGSLVTHMSDPYYYIVNRAP